jgi:hypothetical protein
VTEYNQKRWSLKPLYFNIFALAATGTSPIRGPRASNPTMVAGRPRRSPAILGGTHAGSYSGISGPAKWHQWVLVAVSPPQSTTPPAGLTPRVPGGGGIGAKKKVLCLSSFLPSPSLFFPFFFFALQLQANISPQTTKSPSRTIKLHRIIQFTTKKLRRVTMPLAIAEL